MIPFYKFLLVGGALCTAALVTTMVGCSKGDKAAAADVPTGLGATCETPLPLAGRVAFRGFPEGRDVVALSGKPEETLQEGALALVREGADGHALAMMVDGKPVRIPDSVGAMLVIGATLPAAPGAEPTRILVFSRVGTKPVAAFAKQKLYEVDPATWSLELRVLSVRGAVLASASLPHANESVSPYDIDVKGAPNTASLLVQFDKRAVPGQRIRAERNPSPLSMQILRLTFDGHALAIVEEAREPLDEDDLMDLARAHIPEPSPPPTSCGPILDVFGLKGELFQSGTCDDGSFCRNHECVAVDAGASACVPKPRAELCGAGGCGKRYDGCEAIIECDACPAGQVCGAETAGRCADPSLLTTADVRAVFGGAKVCGCFADGAKTVSVACDPNEKCQDGVCVPQ